LKNAVRRDETIGRIGGEEFLLISTRLDLREAVVAAERLRRQLEHATIDAGGDPIQVAASIGIAAREADMPHAEALMIAADKALYAAKNAGRNRLGLFMAGNIRVLKPSG
jgi:diguanylate cyclase (GGDEF)-like protein